MSYLKSVSHELNATLKHAISKDGYNYGRDLFVNAAMKGITKASGKKYKTTKTEFSPAKWKDIGSKGINHG
jgi:hypothetical protein